MAPYAWGILLVGIFFYLLHLLLRYLQFKFDFLWYRQGMIVGSLTLSRKRILTNYSPFYNRLSPEFQKQFEKRVHSFIKNISYISREGFQITEEVKTIVAAEACKLTFGRRRYLFPLVDRILVYPEAFSSPVNEALHQGEYNPGQRLLVLSWSDVLAGLSNHDDNINLALHEFMHCLHFESEHSNNIDAMRFGKYLEKILERLKDPELQKRLLILEFFRDYAYTNQYEFMAVLAEHIFESPEQFKAELPEIYNYMLKMLNLKEEWLTN